MNDDTHFGALNALQIADFPVNRQDWLQMVKDAKSLYELTETHITEQKEPLLYSQIRFLDTFFHFSGERPANRDPGIGYAKQERFLRIVSGIQKAYNSTAGTLDIEATEIVSRFLRHFGFFANKSNSQNRLIEELSARMKAQEAFKSNNRPRKSYIPPSRVGKKTLLIYLEEQSADDLNCLAEIQGLSVQKLVNKIIGDYIAANSSPEALQKQIAEAAAARAHEFLLRSKKNRERKGPLVSLTAPK